jgi:hypothetical protein
MAEPRERIARALSRLQGHPPDIRFEGKPMRQSFLPDADAALAAAARVAEDWEACCDRHRFVPGAFVWGRGVLALLTEARRPAAYPRKAAAA